MIKRAILWTINPRRKVSMATAYILWFLFGGLALHLLYARRWGMLALHYVAASVLALGWYVSHRGAYQELHDNEILAWLVVLILEAAILAHQVNETNNKVEGTSALAWRQI